VVKEKKFPSIILVMTDDQGWFDAEFNGNTAIKTPNLDIMDIEYPDDRPMDGKSIWSLLTGEQEKRDWITHRVNPTPFYNSVFNPLRLSAFLWSQKTDRQRRNNQQEI